MVKHSHITEIVIDKDTHNISFVEICEHYAISEQSLLEMLEYGLLPDVDIPNRNLQFNQTHLQRILSAFRLQHDLDINAHGVILALELMDEVADLRSQLALLHRHIRS